MIERKIIATQVKNFLVDDYIRMHMKGAEYSHSDIIKTPLGDRVVIYSSRPGLIIGRKGANIKLLTTDLRDKFGLNNPQIEIGEVADPMMDANIVAERIVISLERFGIQRFKGIMHKVMTEVMGAGALGIEIRISGKVPSSRAKAWKILSGYMKKNGDISVSGVRRAVTQAALKSGIIGVQVRIMPKGFVLPDRIDIDYDLLNNYKEEKVVEDALTESEFAQHKHEESHSGSKAESANKETADEQDEPKKKPRKRVSKKKSENAEDAASSNN